MVDNKVVVFKVANQLFGADLMPLQEILLPKEPVKVPNNPAFVEGVIDHRGQVIPVIDLKKRLNLGESDYIKETRFVIAEVGKKKAAFVVDAVVEIVNVDESMMEKAPDMVKINKDYISGVFRLSTGLTVILNLSKVLTVEEQDLI